MAILDVEGESIGGTGRYLHREMDEALLAPLKCGFDDANPRSNSGGAIDGDADRVGQLSSALQSGGTDHHVGGKEDLRPIGVLRHRQRTGSTHQDQFLEGIDGQRRRDLRLLLGGSGAILSGGSGLLRLHYSLRHDRWWRRLFLDRRFLHRLCSRLHHHWLRCRLHDDRIGERRLFGDVGDLQQGSTATWFFHCRCIFHCTSRGLDRLGAILPCDGGGDPRCQVDLRCLHHLRGDRSNGAWIGSRAATCHQSAADAVWGQGTDELAYGLTWHRIPLLTMIDRPAV